jgi:hypothetical protein
VPPNAIYRSTNGGGQWSQRSNGLPVGVGIVGALAIDPANTATIYAGTQSGMYKSVDSGANWIAINTGFTPDPTPTINAVAIDPKNPSIVYVGTGGFGVWKSIDGGASWVAASTGITSSLVNDLVVDPRRPGVLYAATSSSGVFRSTDGGVSWTPFNNGLTVNTIQALALSRSGTCVHAGGNVNGASGPVFDFAWVDGCGDLPSFQGLWWNSPPFSNRAGASTSPTRTTRSSPRGSPTISPASWWLAVVANRTAPNVYSGELFTTTGPAFNAEPFDPAGVTETPVGTATFTFSDANNGTFDYTVNVATPAKAAVTQTKSITRQLFAEPVPTCRWGERFDLAATTNFQDLWWKNPPFSESGWGINFTHQGDVIFATWFTYDLAGQPWWLAIVANKTGPNVYAGDLFTTTGPAFNAEPFDPATVVETPIGTGTFTVVDGNNVQFDYTVSGVTQSKALTRQVFAAPGTACE